MTVRLARQLGALSQLRAAELHVGVVESVSAGPPAVVSVQVNGSAVSVGSVAYLASYSPTAGDVVLVGLLGSDSRSRSSWVVLGKLA